MMTMTVTMNNEARAEPKFSLKRERVERPLAMLDVKRANGLTSFGLMKKCTIRTRNRLISRADEELDLTFARSFR
jgi:hypothetical protein